MIRIITLFLALFMCITLCACNNAVESTEPLAETTATYVETTEAPVETTAPQLTKEDLLAVAVPYTYDDLDTAFRNAAFATTFIGNVYSFEGEVVSIEKEYVTLTFRIRLSEKQFQTWGYDNMGAHVYLPFEELITLKPKDRISIVGKVDDVISKTTTLMGMDTHGISIIFKDAFINQ